MERIGRRSAPDRAPGPTSLVPVELFTPARRIAGLLDRGKVRPSDVFNNDDSPVVHIHKASIYSLHDGFPIASVDDVQVNTAKIMMVVLFDGRVWSDLTEKALLRVPRQPHYVTVELPPYTVDGLIHLPKETVLGEAMLAIPTKFIPLSDATVSVAGADKSSYQASAVIVNRQSIDLLYGDDRRCNRVGQPGKSLLQRMQSC